MRAALLDLNGTLVEPVRVSHPREFYALPHALEAVRLLNHHGFLCPVVTVQSRISKAIFSLQDFNGWFMEFQHQFQLAGAVLLGPYVCPHQRSDACACKKPQTPLYLRAAAEHTIDIAQSVVIGDTYDDLAAAHALGMPGCLVRTGWGEHTIQERQADRIASYIAADILEAARWVTTRDTGQATECVLPTL
jgi:D-glycero-D-manno-heptose 1,7-bisphosphate phosphatase